jgi:hypothetical protein
VKTSHVFDIGTLKGIRRAEVYQKYIEENYDSSDVRIVGVDKVMIRGIDND